MSESINNTLRARLLKEAQPMHIGTVLVPYTLLLMEMQTFLA